MGKVKYTVPEKRKDGTKNGTPNPRDRFGAIGWEVHWTSDEGLEQVHTHDVPVSHPPILPDDPPIQYETREHARSKVVTDFVMLPPGKATLKHLEAFIEEKPDEGRGKSRREIAETWFTAKSAAAK